MTYTDFLLEKIAYLLTPQVQTFEEQILAYRQEYAAQHPPPPDPASPSGVPNPAESSASRTPTASYRRK